MMRAVLADMALEVEGAVAAVMRLCRSFDLAASSPAEAARARLLTPAIKYAVCKAAPALVYEAMECLGGNGYVEEGAMARLYREAPVNAIWEGSGNVMALDVLRALAPRRRGRARGAVPSLRTKRKVCRAWPRRWTFIGKTLAVRCGRSPCPRRGRAARAARRSRGACDQRCGATSRHLRAHALRRAAPVRGYGTAALDAAETALLLSRVLPDS